VLSKFLLDSEGKVIDQLAKYELNNNGEIGKIKIAVNVGWEEDWGEDYFKCNMDTAVAKANYDNKTVTLNLYKDDEITIISDNDCEDDIKVLSNENIVYKTRQGYKKGKVYYNLYLFDGKKSTLIESSISELISVYDSKAE